MPTIWKRSHKNKGPKKQGRRKRALDRLEERLLDKTHKEDKLERMHVEQASLKASLGIN